MCCGSLGPRTRTSMRGPRRRCGSSAAAAESAVARDRVLVGVRSPGRVPATAWRQPREEVLDDAVEASEGLESAAAESEAVAAQPRGNHFARPTPRLARDHSPRHAIVGLGTREELVVVKPAHGLDHGVERKPVESSRRLGPLGRARCSTML